MTVLATDPARNIHVEQCMGTVFTIDIRDRGSWDDAVSDAISWLHSVDRVFSTYRADSDISRIGRGDLDVIDADPRVGEVLGLCAEMQRDTRGYFTAMVNGRLDPTGLVKGWAIEGASDILRAHGSHNHAVNGGGDMQLAGERAPTEHWRVGISDPFDRTRVLTVVTGRDLAVATSGVAERGAHIVNPFTGRPATELASVTVVGTSLTRVDALATAAFAMGAGAFAWLESLPGCEGLVVGADGSVDATARIET
jgi:thiamine biosynthesis lipoprotein